MFIITLSKVEDLYCTNEIYRPWNGGPGDIAFTTSPLKFWQTLPWSLWRNISVWHLLPPNYDLFWWRVITLQVLHTKFCKDWLGEYLRRRCPRTIHDDGRHPISIGKISDSGDPIRNELLIFFGRDVSTYIVVRSPIFVGNMLVLAAQTDAPKHVLSLGVRFSNQLAICFLCTTFCKESWWI